jgi:5-methylcytosine-specific restriction endonuclease McrA
VSEDKLKRDTRYKTWVKENPDKVRANNKRWVESNLEKAKDGWLKAGKKWRDKNREKINAADKKRYKENTEYMRTKTKKYREKNPEKAKAATRKWKSNNPEKVLDGVRRYRVSHPEVAKAVNHKRRLLGSDLSPATVKAVYEDNIKKYGTLTCYLCLNPISIKEDNLEHKTPLSRGGNNDYNNLAVACRKCNFRKNNKTEEEFSHFRDT